MKHLAAFFSKPSGFGTDYLKICYTVEIGCRLDAAEVFIADRIACSTCFGRHCARHRELGRVIRWLLPVVFRAVVFGLLVWCGAGGCVSGLQDAAESCKPDAWPSAPHRTGVLRATARSATGGGHCVVLLGSWWWAWWCPGHVEQAMGSALGTSVASGWHFVSTY